jgi:electron transport complex protein RnfG
VAETTRDVSPGLRQAVLAVAVLLLAMAALVALAQATRARVARSEAAEVMKVLRGVLPPGSYDNEPARDRIFVRAPDLLGSDEPLPLYRARLRGEPAAVVITAIASQGYVGPIRLLIALAVDGRIQAVRVLAHDETPGLGGKIDRARSDWVDSFSGRSLADPPLDRWSTRRDGGDFDQLTGATVTSRAVVHAVRDAALYFERHRAEAFSRPAQ